MIGSIAALIGVPNLLKLTVLGTALAILEYYTAGILVNFVKNLQMSIEPTNREILGIISILGLLIIRFAASTLLVFFSNKISYNIRTEVSCNLLHAYP